MSDRWSDRALHNQERWIAASVESLMPEVDELVVRRRRGVRRDRRDPRSLCTDTGFSHVHAQARGVSEAYNAAVRATRADVILIQGGDDLSMPGRGARTAAALSDADTTLVHSLPIVIDAVDRRLPADAAGEFIAGATMRDPLPYLFNTGNFVCAPSVGVRRTDYVDAGGFPTNLRRSRTTPCGGARRAGAVPLRSRAARALPQARLQSVAGGNRVDSTRLRREAAENALIRNRFLDHAESATLTRIAPTPGAPGAGPLTRDEQALLVRLAHCDTVLVRRGLSDLFDRLADEGDSVLSRLGISRSHLSVFARPCRPFEPLSGLGPGEGPAERLGCPAL